MRCFLSLAAILAWAGCQQILGFESVSVCDTTECAPGDGGSGDCSESSECPSVETPICELSTCRACGEPSECAARGGGLPACVDGSCVECAIDADCDSLVCDQQSHECVDEASVVYLDPTGSVDAACGSKATPCRSVNTALTHASSSRPYLKAADGIYSTDATTITIPGGIEAIILAGDGVIFDLSVAAPVFTVSDNATLTLVGGTVRDTPAGQDVIRCAAPGSAVRLVGVTVTGSGDDGIECTGNVVVEDSIIEDSAAAGIDAVGGANLQVVRSTIRLNTGDGILGGQVNLVEASTLSGNGIYGFHVSGGQSTLRRNTFRSNSRAGVYIQDGDATIANNFVYLNGNGANGNGGVYVTDGGAHTVTIEFNTVASNTAGGPFASGLYCEPSGSSTITSPNNLVYFNGASGDLNSGCGPAFSNFGSPVASGSNFNDAPNFLSMEQHDYHLTAQSPCRDAASPGAVIDIDFDGDPRPTGSGTDCGADEFVP